VRVLVVVAAVGLVAVAAAANPAGRPPVVGIVLTRRAISPNGDSVRDTTRVQVTVDTAASLTMSVQDRRGAVVDSLAQGTAVQPGRTDFTWNGRGNSGRLADGTYVVRARAVADNGSAGEANARVVVDTTLPRIAWHGRWGQRVFGGILPLDLSIADRGSPPLRLQVTLQDQTGADLVGFSPARRPNGPLRLGWRPDGGLGSGAYRVEVTATDEAGNARTTRPRPFLVERRARPHTVAHIDGVGRRVALTFDDCGSRSAWDSILNTLHAKGVKAAFFCPGIYVRAAPAEARRTVADGHAIGSHGWDHANFAGLTFAQARRRLISDREVWWRLAKASPTPLFRPPYGAYNRTAYAAAADAGYSTFVLWDVDPNDWRNPGVSAIVSRVVRAVRPGSIVLLHVRPQTAAALPRILRGLRAKRLVPVALTQLLRMGHPDRRG
jgi:peptidoglycan/xylan/chitin deacetylase (PgdA/CDA1 family)